MKKITSLETKIRIAIDDLEAEFQTIDPEDSKEKALRMANYLRNISCENEEIEADLDRALLGEFEGYEEKSLVKNLIILAMASDAYEYYSYLKSQDIVLNERQKEVLKALSYEKIDPKIVIALYRKSDDFALDLYDNYSMYSLHNDVFLRHVVEEAYFAKKHQHVFKINPLAMFSYSWFLSNYEENFKTQTLIEVMETFYQGLSDIKKMFMAQYDEEDLDCAIYNAATFLEAEAEELEYRDEDGNCLYDEEEPYFLVQYAEGDDYVEQTDEEAFEELEGKIEPLMEDLRLTIIDNILNKTDALYVKQAITLIIKEAYKYLRFNMLDPNFVPLDFETELIEYIENDNSSADDLIETFKNDKDFALKMLFYYIKMKEGNEFAIPETDDYDDDLKKLFNSKVLIKINKYISKGYVNQ